MAIADWSTTAASNTTVEGVSIAEGCPPGNINDWARAFTAALATWRNALDVADGTYMTFRRSDGARSTHGYHDTNGFHIDLQSAGDGFYLSSKDTILFMGSSTGTAERGRFDSNGNFLVAQATADDTVAGVSIRNGGNIRATASATSTLLLNRLTSDGTIATFSRSGTPVGSVSVTTTATAYNTSSDERLKENFTTPTDFGAVLDQVEIVAYDWKVGGHVRWGIKAQQEYANIPEVIKTGSAGDDVSDPWGWSGNPLIAGMMLELQSLRARVAALEA